MAEAGGRIVGLVKLAVIIAAYNEEVHLPAQLDALREQEYGGDWEVVVVDNRSTDRTGAVAAAVSAEWDRLRVVSASAHADKSHALNVGVAATDADGFAFTDADDIVMPGWVAAAADALGKAAIVTGPLELDSLNPPWLAASRGRSMEEPGASFEGLFPMVRGTNYAMTRTAWEALGDLPLATYPVDDIDLSLRAHRAGIAIEGWAPMRVRYRYRSEVSQLWRQGIAYGRGRCRIVRKLLDAGDPRPSRIAGWRSWVWLVVSLPRLATTGGRAAWVWTLANRLGQLRGSVEHRLLYL